MSVRNLFTINTIYSLLNAFAAIFLPATTAAIFGIEAAGTALQIIPMAGATAVGYGIITWLMRGAGPSDARTAFLTGAGIGYLVLGLVSGWVVLGGLGGGTAWVAIAVDLLLGLLFLNYGLRNPNAA